MSISGLWFLGVLVFFTATVALSTFMLYTVDMGTFSISSPYFVGSVCTLGGTVGCLLKWVRYHIDI